jgi:hypothetical protein
MRSIRKTVISRKGNICLCCVTDRALTRLIIPITHSRHLVHIVMKIMISSSVLSRLNCYIICRLQGNKQTPSSSENDHPTPHIRECEFCAILHTHGHAMDREVSTDVQWSCNGSGSQHRCTALFVKFPICFRTSRESASCKTFSEWCF